ncbi:MAG: hypothetical protein ACE5QF_02340 [Thermoplasmata archaeon]
MAKKKGRKEEKVVFKRPSFDEREFMRKELVNAKVGIITFFYGLPFAVVSWQLTLAGLSILGLMAAIIGILSLRYVYPFLGIDVEEFEKKTWLGNGAVFVFTWLSIWVLLLNPPFSDLASPLISDVQVSNDPAGWVDVSRGETVIANRSVGNNITIKAKVVDNVGISRVDMEYGTGNKAEDVALLGGEPDTYIHTFNDETGNLVEVTITAWDTSGHKSTFKFNLNPN